MPHNIKRQGPDSIKRCHLTSIGNPIVEIRRSYDRLISTMGFPILVRRHLYIESGPWYLFLIIPQGFIRHVRNKLMYLLSGELCINVFTTVSICCLFPKVLCSLGNKDQITLPCSVILVFISLVGFQLGKLSLNIVNCFKDCKRCNHFS